jgi:hypothetical protein
MAQRSISYSKLVPTDSFLGRYLAYMRRQETAYAFDWWCGLWAIAAACGRSTYVARPRAPVYLNMYVVLIGDSGVARKTTSVTSAGGLIRQVHDASTVGYIDAKMTAEKLDDLLHERTMEHGSGQLCIAIPELAVFLGTEAYIANMPTLLTDLYDCPSHRNGGGTVSRGERIQRSIWLSFLSASTPIWLLKSINPNVIEGGFTSRCLFILSNEPKQRIPWPDGDDAADDRAWLLNDLRTIRAHAENSDPILLTDGAMTTFRRWYNNRAHALDTYRQSFEAREDAHVLRIAALLCINDDSWRIDHRHIVRAIELVASIKDSSSNIFATAKLRNTYTTALDRVRSQLVSAGMDPIPRYVLTRRCKHNMSAVEFSALMDVLHELGAVQRFSDGLQDRGRTAEYFRGTDVLLSKGLGEQVLERFT